MHSPVKIGLLGCGTIGSEVAEILLNNRDSLSGVKLEKVLVKDLNKPRSISQALLTTNPDEIISNKEIDIVIELLGVEEPALSYVLKALNNGQHLVTANKELIAKHGPAIFEAAVKNNVHVRLDATVGGGIPIINTLQESLKANQIFTVVGILNGTTNYILTQMKQGKEFQAALAEAQEKGYAEPDPTNDLDGIDAKYKTAILASLAFQQYLSPQEVTCLGIKSISAADFQFARELGFSIKLLGRAQRQNNGEVAASVYPSLVPLKEPLANVDDVLNAVQVRGDLVRELLLVGPGAGPKPTSSSILGDVLSIIKSIGAGSSILMPYTTSKTVNKVVESFRFYLRLRLEDQVGVIRDLGAVLANNGISLESIAQKAHKPESSLEDNEEATLILLTHLVAEDKFEAALKEVQKLKQVTEVCCKLRVFE